MKASPEMIVLAAVDAGIEVPSDLENFEMAKYPYWVVFTRMQLGSAMPYSSVDYDNAKVVASVSDRMIKKITREQIMAEGFSIGLSN